MSNCLFSGIIAIAAEVLSNCQMQHGILIDLPGRRIVSDRYRS